MTKPIQVVIFPFIIYCHSLCRRCFTVRRRCSSRLAESGRIRAEECQQQQFRMGLLNKILLILILLSGFLLIFYANINISELFRGPAGSQNQRFVDNDPAQEKHLAMADSPGAWSGAGGGSSFSADAERKTRNHSSLFYNNLFVIYTKETSVLQTKYELLLKSLFKYTTIPLHLHVLTDAKSTYNAEDIARTQMQHYRRPALITLLDVEECVDKINDIVQVMMPYFSSHPGKSAKIRILWRLN